VRGEQHPRSDALLASEKSEGVHGVRYMAERIPCAELVELPGASHAWFANAEPIAHEVERFLTEIWKSGERDVVETERVLATVLFRDIVGSTKEGSGARRCSRRSRSYSAAAWAIGSRVWCLSRWRLSRSGGSFGLGCAA
jgi:hypothetical protein